MNVPDNAGRPVRLKNRNSHRVISLLGFCFLLVVLFSSINREGANSQGRVQASGNESALLRSSEAAALSDETIANCRYGTAAGYGQEQHVAPIGAGWFLNYNPTKSPIPVAGNDAEFVHVFLVYQHKTQDGQYLPDYRTEIPLDAEFASYILANPGDLWLIGNEVDRGPNPGQNWSSQGDMYPEMYARAYHDVRAFIKRHDPTARIAISGLVQVTPGRLQYLDMVWEAYQQRYGGVMPVDVWNMHVYVLPEVEPDGITPNGIGGVAVGTDPALGKRSSGGGWQVCDDPDVYCYAEHDDLAVFGEQVVAMRQWMKAHGQQQKPLILTEYSLLFPYIDDGETCFLQDEYGGCFTPDRVINFMSKSFDYLNKLKDEDLGYALDGNRLVQQWNWFSLFTDGAGTVSNLLESDEQSLSQVGKTFQQTAFAEPAVVNLLVDNIPKVVTAVNRSDTVTAPLKVTFRNNGNTAVDKPFTVTFYKDYERTKKIGSVLISETVRGCTTNSYDAIVGWPGLEPGKYHYWVTVDSEDTVAEGPPQQADNRSWGLVVVYPISHFLPLFAR